MSLVMNYTTDTKVPDFLIDSNILVYSRDPRYPRKKDIAINLLHKGFSGEKSLALTNQNLSEFSRVAVEKNNVDPIIIASDVQEIIDSKITILDSWHINELSLALNLMKQFEIHFWDAKLAATMLSNGIKTIYTENTKDLEKVKGIKVVNPFKKWKK